MLGLLTILVIAVASADEPPASPPERQVASQTQTVTATDGRLVLSSPLLVSIDVRNDGPGPVRVAAVTVADIGTDTEPTVSVRSRAARRQLDEPEIPPQDLLAEGERVVVAARIHATQGSYSERVAATIRFEDGRILETELAMALPISPTPRSERAPVAPPVIIKGPPRSGS